MTTVTETRDIRAPAEGVFVYVDDIPHMTELSSMAMMGATLKLGSLFEQPTGLGATYRYSGRMMSLSLDGSESVAKDVPNRKRIRRTIGELRLLSISSYEMRLVVGPLWASSSQLTTSIAYDVPRSRLWRLIGRLLAGRLQPMVPDGRERQASA